MNVERTKPGPGQESVWDYPRPPMIQETDQHVEVVFAGEIIADTTRALRVLETSHAPAYYIPAEDVRLDLLSPGDHVRYNEFKGEAHYFRVSLGAMSAEDAAWSYTMPASGYERLLDHYAFFPDLVDECRVDGEVVRPQPGGHYGGWVTSAIVGPFRGESTAQAGGS